MVLRHILRETGQMPIGGTVQFEKLTPGQCLTLLGMAHVGRIGLSVHALPVILPVNYVIHDGDVVFRCSSGPKLTAAQSTDVVAFEVDHDDPDGMRGWSILLQGRAELIVEPGEVSRARSLPLHAWVPDGSADHYVRIRSKLMSGRRYQPLAGGDQPTQRIGDHALFD